MRVWIGLMCIICLILAFCIGVLFNNINELKKEILEFYIVVFNDINELEKELEQFKKELKELKESLFIGEVKK